MDLLITELGQYIEKACQQALQMQAEAASLNKTFDLKKVDDQVFLDLFPHSRQLNERLDFIKEVAKTGSFNLTDTHVTLIWESVIVKNVIVSDHKKVSNWLQDLSVDFIFRRDNGSIPYDDLVRFYKHTICADSNNFAKINTEGFNCIQMFFILINLRQDKLLVLDDDVCRANGGLDLKDYQKQQFAYKKISPTDVEVCAKVGPNEMDGINVLWKIAIDCQDTKVGERVA